MNRYSNLSVSQFDPLSLEEVLAVPLYKTAQYNALEEARIKQADMFKIDPLDVHKEEAQRLNSEYMTKVDELANYQARTGDIQGSKNKLLQLQRDYKKLTDPMGKVSQINKFNTDYQAEKNRFLEAASKQYGSNRALELWNQHAKNYTGYNDKGELTGISQRGIVAAKDFDKELQQYHNLLGSTATAAAKAGYNLIERPDGSKIMVNSSGQEVKDSNVDQLNSMKAAMAADWLTPGGAGYQFNQEAGIDQNTFTNKFNNLLDSQLKTKVERKQDVSANYINAPTGSSSTDGGNDNSVFGEDYNTVEIGGEKGDYSEISKIGLANEGLLSPKQYHSGDGITIKHIKDPRQRAIYEKKWKEAITTGVMIDGKKMKLTKEAIDKGMNDRKNAEFILKSLTQSPPITLTSKLLTPAQILNNQGFVAGLGKNAEDINKNIRIQLQRGDASGRKLIDPKTGKTMTWNEAKEEYDFKNIDDVNYQGQISALNWEQNDHIGSNSRFSPHIVTIKDKDDNWHTFKTTRLSSDNVGINVKRQNEMRDNYRDATLNYGEFVPIKSSNPKLNKLKTRYNPSETEIDNRTGQYKNWTILLDQNKAVKVTEADYINFMNSVK